MFPLTVVIVISPQKMNNRVMSNKAGLGLCLFCWRSFCHSPSLAILNWFKVTLSDSLIRVCRKSTSDLWLFSIMFLIEGKVLDHKPIYSLIPKLDVHSYLSWMFTPGKLTQGCLQTGHLRYNGDLFWQLFQRDARQSWQKLWPQWREQGSTSISAHTTHMMSSDNAASATPRSPPSGALDLILLVSKLPTTFSVSDSLSAFAGKLDSS